MKAAIYARYSSENQDISSIDAQIRAIKDYAQRNGFEIVKIYTDEARSATTDDRPQFLQLIKDSEDGWFDIVIVHKLDRFSRDRYDSAFYKRQLKRHGVKLISVLENLDDSPESIILESVLEGMAEYYSKNLAREVMKGMKENALKAKHNGGTPALGYDLIDGAYVINEDEAKAVRYIFERYASGVGYKTLIGELKLRGYKTKRGNDFTQTSIHDILRNERYTGCYIFNRQASKNFYGKRNQHASKSEEDIIRIPGGMPVIISEELFHQIKSNMDKRKNAMRKAIQVYLVSGKIFCGKCEAAMIGHTSHNKGLTYCSYQCGTRYRTKNCDLKAVKKEYVEDKVIENLILNIFNPKSIEHLSEQLMEHYEKIAKEDSSDLNLFKNRLSEIESKLNNIADAIADGMYNPTMKNAMAKLEDDKIKITTAMNDIILKLNKQTLSKELIKQYLTKDMIRLKTKNIDDIKEIINVYVDKVIVYDDRIITNLKVVHTTGAGNGDRTRTTSLGSWDSTIELYLHDIFIIILSLKIAKSLRNNFLNFPVERLHNLHK